MSPSKDIKTAQYHNELTENMAEGVVLIHTEDQKIVYTNKRFNEMFGYEEGELIGKPVSVLNAPTDKHPEETASTVVEALKKNGFWRGEIENITKDGSVFTCEASVTPFHHSTFGEVWVSVHNDITEQKRSEETINTLLKSMVGYTGQEFFDRIVEILSNWLGLDCSIIGEIDGNNVHTMAMWMDDKVVHGYNYSLPGTPCEQVTAKGFCTYPENIVKLFPTDKDLVDIGAEGYVGYPLLNKEGKEIGLMCSISRKKLKIPPNTEDVFKIISAKAFVEIERIQAERKLQEKNRELDELNKQLEQRVQEETESRLEKERLLIQQSKMAAMGEMLSAIAHQWRQPLNSIGLILQDFKDAHDFNELNEEYIDNAIDSGMKQINFMSKTINDFRNFYKPSKNKLSFDIESALEATISLISAQANEREITIKTEHSNKDELTLFGYPNEFEQAVLNLLHNAIDAVTHSYETGNLEKGKGVILVKNFLHDNRLFITVENNGGAIPEKYLSRIFEPYFTTKEDGKGTGIGLYMAQMIVKNMKGELSVENLPDGVRFQIKF